MAKKFHLEAPSSHNGQYTFLSILFCICRNTFFRAANFLLLYVTLFLRNCLKSDTAFFKIQILKFYLIFSSSKNFLQIVHNCFPHFTPLSGPLFVKKYPVVRSGAPLHETLSVFLSVYHHNFYCVVTFIE